MSCPRASCFLLSAVLIAGGCSVRKAQVQPLSVRTPTSAAPGQGWEKLRELKRGSKIRVSTKDGRLIRGVLADVSSDSVSVRSQAFRTPVVVRRNEVSTISKKRSRRKGTLWGFAVGAGIGGAVAGYGAPQTDGLTALAIPVFGAGLGGLGALLGWLASGGEEVIYASP